MAKNKGWGKVKKAIKRSKPAKIIAKTAKANRPTTIKGLKIPKLATTVEQRSHEKAAPNPLTGMIQNAGVATSIWNNIRYKPEGFQYWINIIKHQIENYGISFVQNSWMREYFNSSANYEDSNSLYYNTDYRQGDSILDEWEDSTITDAYNENVDDPNDRAINVEDIAIINGLAKGSTDEPIIDAKAIAEEIRKLIRKLVRKGYSIRDATQKVLANIPTNTTGDKWLWGMVARNEGRKVQEEINDEKLAKFIKQRNKRMAAERAKHPQKYLKVPTSNKGFNVPKGK